MPPGKKLTSIVGIETKAMSNQSPFFLNPFPNKPAFLCVCRTSLLKILWEKELEALERLYRSTGLIFLQWQKKFLTIIIQSLHFSSLKKKGMEKTCEKRRKKW